MHSGLRRFGGHVAESFRRALRSAPKPPKVHDVGDLIVEYSRMFPEPVRKDAQTLKEISHWLRKEREFAFYGEVDLIPTL